MKELIDNLAKTLSETLRREVIDPAVIDQGATWVLEFKKAFPALSFFVDVFINGTPEAAFNALIGAKPEFARWRGNSLAIATIGELQKKLKSLDANRRA